MPQSLSNTFSVRIQPVTQPGALPPWVPPAGYFADVPMLNNPQDVMPSMYQSNANDSYYMNNPFIIWGGSAVLHDFSPLGAQVYYSGGHEATYSNPNIQMSLICDFSTLSWHTANLPMAPNIANTFVNGVAADGTPYCTHTYLGLQELPTAWGGAQSGSLVSFFYSGTGYENRINILDVSRNRMGYSHLVTRQPQNADPTKIRFSANSAGGSYPITVIDRARQGWWAAVNGNIDYLLFVAKSGEITQYPALGGNLSNGAMALCTTLDLLVAIDGGYVTGQYAGTGYRKLYIRNLRTGAMTTTTTLGAVPSLHDGYDGGKDNFYRPDQMGLQWVDELGCIVGLDEATVPPTVVKLTPPPTDPATGQWTWSRVTALQHWPQDSGGHATLQSCENGVWSKFRWVSTLQGFVYGTEKSRKPQIIRLS